MTPFEAYKLFLAMKMHFTSPSYDFVKYHGSVRVSYDSFDRRRDKYMYQKLADKKDPQGFLLANFIARDVKWIGDVIGEEADSSYLAWLSRRESLTYVFKNELEILSDSFVERFKCSPGEYPDVLKKYQQNKISIDTLVILNELLTFVPYWDKIINENVIWPRIKAKLLKYTSFVPVDKRKFKPLVLKLMRD